MLPPPFRNCFGVCATRFYVCVLAYTDPLSPQREDWPLHRLECTPMVVFGENWSPSETVRLTARILAKQVIEGSLPVDTRGEMSK